MRTGDRPSFLKHHRGAVLQSLLWLSVAQLTLAPAPLAQIARLYHAVCAWVPALTIPGRLVPPLPLALLVLVACVVVVAVIMTALQGLIATRSVARNLDRLAAPAPIRLTNAAESLALAGRLIYVATPASVALCFGIIQSRIAVSAGLLEHLNDEELTALLLHERHHLKRRDPLRYLAARALNAGLFMVPLAPFVMCWVETRIELAADRAALEVVPRGALAGALVAALVPHAALPAGVASLGATEARIAHVVGRPVQPGVPVAAGLATMSLALGTGVAMVWLARPEQVWEIVCALCPGLT